MLSSIFLRRVIAQKIGHRSVARKFFCSGSDAVFSELVARASPCLMMPPSFSENGDGEKMVHQLWSYQDRKTVSFNNRGGKEEASLFRDEHTIWVGASRGWLTLFNHLKSDIILLNPVSGRTIQLPPFRGKPFRKSEAFPFPSKLILSHSPEEEECRAVMIVGSSDRVAFCRPGRCSEWTPVGRWAASKHDKMPTLYSDIVYSISPASKSFVCAVRQIADLYRKDRLMFWEDEGLALWKTVEMPDPLGPDCLPNWYTYLVPEEDSGRLYLVRRCVVDTKSVDYKVYLILEDGLAQLCSSSLNGLVMFVGNNHSFAVKASRFPMLKPDSIYFSGNWFIDNQCTDIFEYPSKTYTQVFDLAPYEEFGFHSTLPWLIPTID